jgi:hypothetical protein
MKAQQIIKLLLITIVFLTSCYYDVEENLYPANDCATANMSYQTNIAPILQRNCYACHSAAANTANITLEGHGELIKHVNSGRLLGAINHEPGFTPMPQGASQLPDCDIAKIEQWVADGAPNN